MLLAWGKKVPTEFQTEVVAISKDLGINPSWLMACMMFETGGTFSPFISNAAGSGAVGLIQFMPQTAQALGTSTEKLRTMTALAQLQYVFFYFHPRAGDLHSLEDVYMAILWPAAIGKGSEYVLFDKADTDHPKRYIQNAGLDFNHDGKITKEEACRRVVKLLEKGLLPENAVNL